MVSGNDPFESLLNSIQVAFSPLESNLRNVAKNFGDCFNGVVKSGAADDIKAEQAAATLNVKNSSRRVVINVDGDRKLPVEIFPGLFTEKCGSSNNSYNSDSDRDKNVILHRSKNGMNVSANCLLFDLALSFVINGFVRAFLGPFKAEKMGLKNMRNKGSSSCDDSAVRVKVKSRMLEPKGLMVKEERDLPFEHLVTFDQLSNFLKFDVVMKDHECKVNQFEHFRALSSVFCGKRASMNGFFRNLNFARVGGVPSSLLGLTSVKDVGEECISDYVNQEGSGGDSTEKLLRISIGSKGATVTTPPPVEISTDSVLKSALAGGIACAFSTFLMHPVDTVKVQASTLSFTEILSKLPQLGVRGLYMGSIPAIVGQFSSHGLRTGICEASKVVLINVAPSLPEIQVHSVASFLGTFLGTTMRIPCEVLKQRLQAGQFNHVGEALVGTWQQDGLGGFFRGTGMTLCRELPFYVFGSGLYAESKKAVQKLLGRELQPWETIAVGAISGGLTAVLTTPFDVIKTRMMTALQGQPTTMSIVALSILRDEGPLGLFRGAVPRFFWVAPLGAINFAGYELLRKAMD